MSPRVPRVYLELRQAEIVEAAITCFMEKGFHNTTMQDIYKASKLSPGAVYNYFRNKEDIVSAAVEISQKRNTEMITKAASGDLEDVLVNLGHLYFTCARDADFARSASVDFAIYAEACRNERIHAALRMNQDAVIANLVELIKRDQLAGVFNDKLDAVAIARVLFGILMAVEFHKSLEPDLDMDSYAAVFEAIVKGTFSMPRKGNSLSKDPEARQK
ncbi:MAG: TetR/AcrR family transcriptional regulator [Dehalococcoidia bacterium]|nr:TetR/AcrR family transcriptional regulator [Dehalococcoidia bacterium]